MFKKACVKMVTLVVLMLASAPLHLQADWIRQRRVR